MDGCKYVVMQYNGQSDEYGSEDVDKFNVNEYVNDDQITNGDVVDESVRNFGVLDEMIALIEEIGVMMKVLQPVAPWDNNFAREDVDTLA